MDRNKNNHSILLFPHFVPMMEGIVHVSGPRPLKMPIQYRTSLIVNQVSYRKKQKLTKCLIAFPFGFQYHHPQHVLYMQPFVKGNGQKKAHRHCHRTNFAQQPPATCTSKHLGQRPMSTIPISVSEILQISKIRFKTGNAHYIHCNRGNVCV